MSIESIYEKIQKIGEGTYGIVYRVRHSLTKKEFAMKQIKLDPGSQFLQAGTMREISLLQLLRHENIVSLIDYEVNLEQLEIKLIFEYYGLSLETLITKSKSPLVIKKTISY